MLNGPIIGEFTHESSQTKKLLEKVPANKFDWKPHGRSMSLGKLAAHVANTAQWMTIALTSDEFDFLKSTYKEEKAATEEDLLKIFQTKYDEALQSLQNASDESLKQTWTFRRGEQVIFSMPRIAAIRTLAMNHLIHHRGQLSVYLRLLDIPIPGMYGPSADEM